MVNYLKALLILGIVTLTIAQDQNTGDLNQNIYQFLKKTSLTSTFIGVIERSAQAARDNTLLTALGYGTTGKVLPTDNSGSDGVYTVFAPVNDALTQLPSDADQLRNDMYNLVMKGRITLESLKQQKEGKNVTSSETFGFNPRLRLRAVANFYNRQLIQSTSQNMRRKKRQMQQQPILNNSMTDTNLYEQYEALYGQKPAYQGPPISPKLPQDELYLLNSAIILDKFELSNGIVYLIDSYPQYYQKSLYTLAKDNSVSGLSQNINFWITRADQSFNKGDENLKYALNAFGPNTFFLPTDASFNKFTDRNLLNNDSFLVDTVLKSHRISNQILYDYYLNDPSVTYMTDGKLPVSTKHRYVDNQLEIEVSIGHVKGKILPNFRNIHCVSGVIHLIDTVLGIPTDSAYKKISDNQKLSTFRQLIDASSTYKQLLSRSPISSSQQQTASKQMTILAPNDMGLLAIKDDLLKNTTALDDFLGAHIITDGSNKIFFTDHDESIFTNGRQYSTMSPGTTLTTQVSLDPDGVTNNVVFTMQANPSVKARIVDGNDLVSNGVIHIIDKPLTLFTSSDIAGLLEKYSSMNSPEQPAFSQFVDALRSTGIFNDLKEPSKQYTLFIPTNEALAQYQDIMKGNDEEKKKQLIYRHICIDQNLQSKNLAPNNSGNSGNMQQQEKTLICRNALGQDLTLTKDGYDLISKWQGKASSKILNDFPGVYSSAYVLDTPLLNHNLPNLGLIKYNTASCQTMHVLLLLVVTIASSCWCTLLH